MARHINLERHEFVKAQLRIAGTSLAEISRDLGLSQATVGAASAGYSRSKRVEMTIAERLDSRPEDLWPERYPKKEDLTPK